MYKRILLAYDGSVEGRTALREGALLARQCGAEVFLLSVVAEDKRGEPKLKVKIKKGDGTWTTCYRALQGDVPVGWQYKKPAGFRVTFYFGAFRDPKKIFWPEGEKDADTLDELDPPVFTLGGVGDGLPDEVDRYLKQLTGRLFVTGSRARAEKGQDRPRLRHQAHSHRRPRDGVAAVPRGRGRHRLVREGRWHMREAARDR
jgi:hypothetical protein